MDLVGTPVALPLARDMRKEVSSGLKLGLIEMILPPTQVFWFTVDYFVVSVVAGYFCFIAPQRQWLYALAVCFFFALVKGGCLTGSDIE